MVASVVVAGKVAEGAVGVFDTGAGGGETAATGTRAGGCAAAGLSLNTGSGPGNCDAISPPVGFAPVSVDPDVCCCAGCEALGSSRCPPAGVAAVSPEVAATADFAEFPPTT